MRPLLFGIIILFLSACSDAPDGYSTVSEGVYRQVLGFDEENGVLLKNGYAAVLSVKVSKEEKIWEYQSIMDLDPKSIDWTESAFFRHLGETLRSGDSLNYQLRYKAIKSSFLDAYLEDEAVVADTTQIRMQLAVRTLYDEEEYFNSPVYKALQRAVEERELIGKIIQREGLTEEMTTFSGGWYRVLREGNGIEPRVGDPLTLVLTGVFLDGEVFDVAKDSTEYLYFAYGKPDQVVRGIQQSIGYMTEGEIRELWLPSDMAFGERGSEDIVPPNTPVKFIVEMRAIGLDSLQLEDKKEP